MQVGDVVTVKGLPEYTGSSKGSKKKNMQTRTMEGKVIHIADKHFTIDNGIFSESFLFFDYPEFVRSKAV